jgi:ribonuclease III
MNQKLEVLQQVIKYQFKNISFLDQALVHRSSLNEQRQFDESNERYEFLGDAVLELWISDRIFSKFTKFDEGKLTNLRALVVCTQNLAKIAAEFNLGDFIYLSHGEENHGGRTNQSILADTFEAILGSIYLDNGLKPAFEFLDNFLEESVKVLSSKEIYKDPKSIFQEIAQSLKGITPKYKTISASGPDHQKTFEVGVYLESKLIATGEGNSKQKAEESASIKATKLLKIN